MIVYELPLPREATLLHPEQVMLRFGDQGTVDIGALCYLQRDAAPRRKRGVGRRVDLASFDQQRADRLRTLIGYFSEVFAHSGRRAVTLRGMIQTFIGSFIDWADANGHASVLDGEPRPARRSVITSPTFGNACCAIRSPLTWAQRSKAALSIYWAVS